MSSGRIIKNYNGYYYVACDDGRIVTCKVKGKMKQERFSAATGDIVEFEENSHGESMITKIAPRKNFLLRPTIANLDCVVIVFACAEPDFSYLLADKMLAFAEYSKIPAVLCLNKADSVSPEAAEEIASVYRKAGYDVYIVSALCKQNTEALKEFLKGKISAFAGPSGVGKSSLVNALQPGFDLRIGDVSAKIGRGKHTTRYSQLIEFDGGYLADTPGFGNLLAEHIEAETTAQYFKEFSLYETHCKFAPCSHTHEPICGVREAVASGEISKIRYDSYLSILDEIKLLKEKSGRK